MHRARRVFLLLGVLAGAVTARGAESSRVAVAAAANLVYALEALNREFKRAEPTIAVTATTGASGTLFAQIKNGAPFDVFLSADTEYPERIAADQLGDRATLRTFATGRLVVWTTRTDLDVTQVSSAVENPAVKKIAIAQPRTAPYGRAAQAALETLHLWTVTEPKLVMGENITQTAQFVETGNADLGFVALSLVLSTKLARSGQWAEVPLALYAGAPLDHACILTRRGASNPAAQKYLVFLGSEPAKTILRRFGYRVD